MVAALAEISLVRELTVLPKGNLWTSKFGERMLSTSQPK